MRTLRRATLAAVFAIFGAWWKSGSTTPKARSFVEQSFHFFSRPHSAVPAAGALAGTRAAWLGESLDPAAWQYVLSTAEKQDALDSVAHAAAVLAARNASLSSLMPTDFPLRALLHAIRDWRRELRGVHGRGFVLVRGAPIDQWTLAETELFFWGLGLHLGVPGAQNNDGELLGHVRDVGGNPKTERQFKTRAEISLHCDAADVVGLLCVDTATSGGASTLVSSVSVYNTLAEEQPELAAALFNRRFLLDSRRSGGIEYVQLPIAAYSADGELRTFWHSEYLRSWTQYPSAPPMPDDVRRALDAWDAIAARPGYRLPMVLRRGDIQLCNNHVIAHGRSAFQDSGRQKRHLLRLWLSLDTALTPRDRAFKAWSRAQLTASFVWGRQRGVARKLLT